jgi:hypothetical protein
MKLTKEKLKKNYDEIIGDIEKLSADRFDLLGGDCGNFAVALGNTVDPNEENVYACSYEDKMRLMEGEPAHCGLIWKNQLWDGTGSYPVSEGKDHLYRKAIIETPHNLDEIVVDYPIPKEIGIKGFREIYQPNRVKKLQNIIKKNI